MPIGVAYFLGYWRKNLVSGKSKLDKRDLENWVSFWLILRNLILGFGFYRVTQLFSKGENLMMGMSWSSLLLAVYLVLAGLGAFGIDLGIVTPIVALASGVLMFLKK